MPSIPGKYQHYKNENMEEYFGAIGVPYMGRKMMGLSSPLMEITVEGDNVSIKTTSMLRTIENKFQVGAEYEDPMPGITLKSVTKIVNGNELVTESVIPDTGVKSGRHYLFTDDECVITFTHEKTPMAGKRFFKRVQ
ncbi:cellular retinoic acid-binding protein 2-like [Epargyreus clarus]|uniref:cellular retinoic acid-binding protein 2-like n=1 Tax=Epargyreus clarus TaxID=520877 RepID=UPI003C2E7C23